MNTQDIADDLVALCKTGDFATPGDKYWAEEVRSIEPMGDNAVSVGRAAAKAKGEWWSGAHDVHRVEVEGPYVNGDQFVVRFKMDVTVKDSGHRMLMDEMAVYSIKDGKIAEERFFYGG